MHIETIEIRNFRSFQELKVGLHAGLNVLLGRNNTGKTNLLMAIRHAWGPAHRAATHFGSTVTISFANPPSTTQNAQSL